MTWTEVLPLIGLGSLLTTVVGGLFLYNVNRSQAAKLQEEARSAAKMTALAEAEKLVAFNNARFAALEKDCGRCLDRLAGAHRSIESLIEAVGAMMNRVEPTNGHEVTITVTGAEIATVRSAVSEARRHLN